MESHYEEYSEYFECDCPDAKKNKEISDKIYQLNWNRPREKFRIDQGSILYKLEENEF